MYICGIGKHVWKKVALLPHTVTHSTEATSGNDFTLNIFKKNNANIKRNLFNSTIENNKYLILLK